MVTGRLPFKGDYEQVVAYNILNEEPEPITALRAGVPMELEWIVGKALAKDAAERYQHVEEMIVDLRGLTKKLASGKSTILPTGIGAGDAPCPAGRNRGPRPGHSVLSPSIPRRRLSTGWDCASYISPGLCSPSPRLPCWYSRSCISANPFPKPRSANSVFPRPKWEQNGRDHPTRATPPLARPCPPMGAWWLSRPTKGPIHDVWVYDIARGVQPRLTSSPEPDGFSVWSPGGEQVAFSSLRAGNDDIFLRQADGSGEAKQLFASPGSDWVSDWSRAAKAKIVDSPARF